MTWNLPRWSLRALLGVFALVVGVWVVTGWLHANAIREEFLIPGPALTGYPLTIEANEAGRVVMTRTVESEREGVWGLEGQHEANAEQSFAQVSTIVRMTDTSVERGVKSLAGTLAPEDIARINPDAFTGDPTTAFSIGYEDLVTPSEIGPHAGWFVDGRRPTWVVFVHGRGDDRLGESLRMIPSLVEQGFPIMVITYRNDVDATASPSGMRLWGLDEWQDVDAAVRLAQRKGAKDFVVFGSGFGASIVSTFLHESDQIGQVRGVIYDSPMLDLDGVVSNWASDGGTPGVVSWLGRRFASIRFGVEWDALDQLRRVDEFDVPMLLMTGGEDHVTPAETAADFAKALGDLAHITRFEQAGHTDLWNIDPERYEATIKQWLLEVLGPE
jgi:alpha-beta hydrolase superfamily lysophospholipase